MQHKNGNYRDGLLGYSQYINSTHTSMKANDAMFRFHN